VYRSLLLLCDYCVCLHSDVPDLRAQISLANTIGENERAEWLKKVLDLDNKTLAVDNQGPYSPQDYLNKGKTLFSEGHEVRAVVREPVKYIWICLALSWQPQF
jgi:hypothetical protein